MRYVIVIDSRAPDLLADCFTEDAVIDLGGVDAGTVAQYIELCRTALPGLDATQHHLSMPAIDAQGDRAFSRCYFVAQHLRNDLPGGRSLVIGGWYDDEFTRTDAGWRICRRIGTPVWYDGNPAVLGADLLPGATPRGPGHSVPAWMT